MAILISAHNVTKTFGSRPLFENLSFAISTGERIGLIGPNGAGKSTLLKILADRVAPDGGNLSRQKGVRIGFLEQTPFFEDGANVLTTILEGSRNPHDWEEMAKAQELMSKLLLDEGERKIEELSGGWKKRVALARELMREPDLLLLDEPTNHLDVESIIWLEDFLAQARFATVVITHDRQFLQNVSNQIIELDRRYKDGLLRVQGDYSTYLEMREQLLSGQEARETKLRNTLRRETEWLRRGAQARQTKQQARIRSHEELSAEVGELESRNRDEKVRLDFLSVGKSPKKLIEAKQIQKSYNGQLIVPCIDLLITPQSRIGLLGPNGCGKSTMIRLLAGTEAPDSGSVSHSDQLEISYFQQNRESLDPNLSVLQSICPAGEYVTFGDSYVHAKSYLARFLFSYEQMEMPVRNLSGGEQSRLLIARLMLKRANVLILDEPTNDLDIATLNVLQDVLEEFQGAVILVTHDRFFLDQVTNRILAFGHNEKGEKVIEHFADLSQWEEWRTSPAKTKPEGKLTAFEKSSSAPAKKKKLSFKEQLELDGMEEKIERLEQQLHDLTAETQTPAIASHPERLVELTQQMAALQTEIDRHYVRWSELESKLPAT